VILRTIDAHVGGQPLRLIVDGFPSPRGPTMLDRREWASRHADVLRRALLFEPRGHADLSGAVLTEPVSPSAHAGVLFLNHRGWTAMSGHGIIAVTTIALERGLVAPGGDGLDVVYDTPAGTIRARARLRAATAREGGLKVEAVSFDNVPSFVLYAGVSVSLASRRVRADVAYGGEFFAIVDSEATGLAIDAAHVPELRRIGMAIADAVDSKHAVAHPLEPALAGIAGTVFTGPPNGEGADLKNVAVVGEAEVDRSACGTATSAVMAVVDAMGLLDEQKAFVTESLIGTRLTGSVARRTLVGEYPAIVPRIEGAAWITGEHTFLVDDDDPLKVGFRL
jgi:proline racemase